MILLDANNYPSKSLYVVGALVLQRLQMMRLGRSDVMLLFDDLNSHSSQKFSFDQFMLTLDWLFILGKIDIDKRGDIVKCF